MQRTHNVMNKSRLPLKAMNERCFGRQIRGAQGNVEFRNRRVCLIGEDRRRRRYYFIVYILFL